VVKTSLRQSNPAAVKEIFRLFRAAKQAATAMALDPLQFGVKNIRRSLELIIEYSAQQKLIPRQFVIDDLFDELTRELV
jgi:4,5-dihydroxyphthalate decarboxylase